MHRNDSASSAKPAVAHRRSVPVYVGSGGIATASHYAVTAGAIELLSVMPIVASAVGYTVGAIIKYWLNYSVAFRSTARHTHAMLRFVLTQAVLLALNTVIFGLLQGGLKLHYLLAQALTTILLIPPGYLIHRIWVFR